jgi:hypothetical protein
MPLIIENPIMNMLLYFQTFVNFIKNAVIKLIDKLASIIMILANLKLVKSKIFSEGTLWTLRRAIRPEFTINNRMVKQVKLILT